MRVLPPVGAAAVAAAAATVLFAPAASAHTGSGHNPPGDNGTVKIHDATTKAELVKNEPHVCTFYIDAFFFDGHQSANWWIDQQQPTGRDKVKEGTLTPDATGHGRTADMTLPNGHYKLMYTFDGEHGAHKGKVFWADCPADGTTTGGTTGDTTTGGTTTGGTTTGDTTTGGTTGSTTTGGATTGGTTAGGTTGGSTTGGSTSGGTTTGGTPTSSTSAPAATSGDSGKPGSGSLASTGASVVGVSAMAALLLAVGAAFRFRRRGSSSRH